MEKNLRKFIVIGIILLMLVLILINLENFKNIFIGEKYSLKDLKKENIIKIDGYKGVEAFKSGEVCIYTEDELKLLSKENKELTKYNRSGKDLHFSDERIYIIDKAKGDLKILNLDGKEEKSFKLDKNIYRLLEKDNKLLVHFKVKDLELVKLLDLSGKELSSLVVKDGFILTYDSLGGDYIVSLVESNNDINSILKYIKGDGKEAWSINFDNEVILRNHIIKDSKVLLNTDEHIYMVEDGDIVWKRKIDDIKAVDFIDDNIYILYHKALEAIDLNGEVLYKLSLEKQYDKILSIEDMIILAGDRNILGVDKGIKRLEFASDKEIEDIYSNGSKLYIRSGDYLIIYRTTGKQID